MCAHAFRQTPPQDDAEGQGDTPLADEAGEAVADAEGESPADPNVSGRWCQPLFDEGRGGWKGLARGLPRAATVLAVFSVSWLHLPLALLRVCPTL